MILGEADREKSNDFKNITNIQNIVNNHILCLFCPKRIFNIFGLHATYAHYIM